MSSTSQNLEKSIFLTIRKNYDTSLQLQVNGVVNTSFSGQTCKEVLGKYMSTINCNITNTENYYIEEISLYNVPLKAFNYSSAHFPKLKKLTIVNCGTTEFKNIHTFEDLYDLTLEDNGMTEFPSQICKMKDLAGISMSGNELTSLPEELFTIEGLSYMNFKDNKIKSLANVNKQSSTLAHIYFGNNLIEEVGEINIPEDHELEIYDLSENELKTIPESFNKLVHLMDLDLSENPNLVFDNPSFKSYSDLDAEIYSHVDFN